MFFSKSKYCNLWQCPKITWLRKYKPEQYILDEGVHNGSEAMSIFPKLKDMEPHEREEMRKNLLKYCELDTYAMVKVWEELVRASN